MLKRIILSSSLLLVAGACATGRATVSDAQLARVPAAAMAPVNEQRLAVASARDAMSRRQLAIQSAENEIQLARQEVAAAEEELERARLALENARFNRDPVARKRAEQDLAAANARREASRAHVELAQASVGLAEARHRESRERLELAQAELDWRKYQALVDAGDPAAREINSDRVLRQLRREREDLDDALQEVARRQAEVEQERGQWRASNLRYQELRGLGGGGEQR